MTVKRNTLAINVATPLINDSYSSRNSRSFARRASNGIPAISPRTQREWRRGSGSEPPIPQPPIPQPPIPQPPIPQPPIPQPPQPHLSSHLPHTKTPPGHQHQNNFTQDAQENIPRDPEVDPHRLCRGCILYIHKREICGDAISSRSSRRMGTRKAWMPAMRDLGYGHPCVVLDHGVYANGTIWMTIANITSFANTSIEDCLQYTRDYHRGTVLAPNGVKTIKYANTLLFKPLQEDIQLMEGDMPFLSTTGGKMSKGCAVATEGSYEVPPYHVRAYGTNFANSWNIRLKPESLSLIMREMNLVEGRYESLDEMFAMGTPRENVKMRDLLRMKSNELSGTTSDKDSLVTPAQDQWAVKMPEESSLSAAFHMMDIKSSPTEVGAINTANISPSIIPNHSLRPKFKSILRASVPAFVPTETTKEPLPPKLVTEQQNSAPQEQYYNGSNPAFD